MSFLDSSLLPFVSITQGGGGGGTDTSSATATQGDMLLGKTAYVKGIKLTGTIPMIASSVEKLTTASTEYIIPIGYHSGTGKVSIDLQEKTVSPTKSLQYIIPDTGKVLSKVSVNPIGNEYIDVTTTNAIASDVVSGKKAANANGVFTGTMTDNGDITTVLDTINTSVTIEAGHVNAGSISISTQTKSVTPTTTSLIITPDSGKVLSQVTVSGDSDLVPTNIKKDVNLFGVVGTYEADFSNYDNDYLALLNRTENIFDIPDVVTSLGDYAFYHYEDLAVILPETAISIGNYTFAGSGLTALEVPRNVSSIGNNACENNILLTKVNILGNPTIKGNTENNGSFKGCSEITNFRIGGYDKPITVNELPSYALNGCSDLTVIVYTPNRTTLKTSPFGANSATIIYRNSNAVEEKAIYDTTVVGWRISNSNLYYSDLVNWSIGDNIGIYDTVGWTAPMGTAIIANKVIDGNETIIVLENQTGTTINGATATFAHVGA